jgi:CRISPR-associated endonuclease/helicase Cas3
VICGASTVDQVGSRLLFRGYGVTEKAAPIHAGLIGNDCALFLDEVHLSEPFRQTLTAIDEHFRLRSNLLPDRWQITEMSATPGNVDGAVFRLDDSDRRHPVLARRLRAQKSVSLETVDVSGSESNRLETLARRAVDRALGLIDEHHRTVAIVVNRVDTARRANRLLQKRGVARLLLTGRSRSIDRESTLDEHGWRLRTGHERDPAAEPLVVVSTQCIEAGADFDFDGLVTECASLDALRQRFGRVDRSGNLSESGHPARSVILSRSDDTSADPIYGEAMANTWALLSSREPLDFGIDHLPLPDDIARYNAPKDRAPVLLEAHLDLLCQTNPLPQADPDIALWLHGIERPGTADAQVAWRADLTEALLVGSPETALRAVATCPPGSIETVTIPVWALTAWLSQSTAPPIADVEGGGAPPEPLEEHMTGFRRGVAWRGNDSVIVRSGADVRPGDTIVVPADYGGLTDGNWDPEATDPVVDRGNEVQERQYRRRVLRLHPQLLSEGTPHPPLPMDPTEDSDTSSETGLDEWLTTIGETPSRWSSRTVVGTPPAAWWVLSYRLPRNNEGDEVVADLSPFDDSSYFVGEQVSLEDHLRGVAAQARRLATLCGLPGELIAALGRAGELHDIGKADPRFQVMLHGGDEVEAALAVDEGRLLAKSATPAWDRRQYLRSFRASRLPARYRHEATSVALADSLFITDRNGSHESGDTDLVLHLIATHHGHFRPLGPPVLDTAPALASVNVDGRQLVCSTDHGLYRADSGLPDRFWRLASRYGWWGLAWLEAIFILADHAQSGYESRRG